MSISETARKFYADHYQVLRSRILQPGKVSILGDEEKKVCRFCGLRSPQVYFSNEAHAIPETTGNKSLYTHYECDACNSLFGVGIENDFGNWTKPMRAISRIIGKKGVPTIKQPHDGWRIKSGAAELKIYRNVISSVSEIDETNKIIRLKLPRDLYTPVAVLKTFFKMGLTLLPDDEICYYRSALEWIRCSDHGNSPFDKYEILHTSYRWHPGNGRILLILLRRISENDNLPYIFFIISYGHEQFQVALLSPERDQLINIPFEFQPWPCPSQWSSTPGFMKTKLLDLAGREIVRGDVETIEIDYGEKTRL